MIGTWRQTTEGSWQDERAGEKRETERMTETERQKDRDTEGQRQSIDELAQRHCGASRRHRPALDLPLLLVKLNKNESEDNAGKDKGNEDNAGEDNRMTDMGLSKKIASGTNLVTKKNTNKSKIQSW